MNIKINTKKFFETLKLNDTSMWEIFAQMIDGTEKNIIFLDENNEVLFQYSLPNNIQKLEEDRLIFSQIFQEKLKK